jgi:mono/diheme cytochrome c family protein
MNNTIRRIVVSLAPLVLIAGVLQFSTRFVVASPVGLRALQDPAPAGSVLAGVYTSEQATRGDQVFRRECASCHTVAEHSGKKFEERWSDNTVGDLFEVISTTMPDGNPGSLDPADYVSVIAFFLKETGYPEGKQQLPSEAAALKQIKIVPQAQ